MNWANTLVDKRQTTELVGKAYRINIKYILSGTRAQRVHETEDSEDENNEILYHELIDVRLSKNNFRIYQEKTNRWRECTIQIINTVEVSQSKKKTIKKAIENNYPRGGKRHEPWEALER